MSGDKKLVYFLVAFIIFLSIILLVKIETKPKYNPKVYDEIYTEYEYIFGEEDSVQRDEEGSKQNIQHNNSIAEKKNYQAIVIGTTENDLEQSNVIGKIIIPKIKIQYPIIKETTTEYLKVAPTKYCGPGVNEVRKFSNSWS